MTRHARRSNALCLLAPCIVAIVWASACSGDDKKRVPFEPPDGAAGAAGANDSAGAGGVDPSAGAGGDDPAAGGVGGADPAGGAAGAPADNCPTVDDPNQADLDADGLGDLCDDDIDGDGFPNLDDPAPTDSTSPGDFSSVDAILADPRVQQALTDLEAVQIDLGHSTLSDPPDVSGFYRKADLDGQFVATSNDTDIGRTVIGLEHWDQAHADGTIDSKVAGFQGTTLVTTTNGRANFLRGTGDRFSVYSRDVTRCTDGTSPFTTYSIRIVTGDIEAATGDTLGIQVFSVTVAVDGTLSPTCTNLLAGETEVVGGWSVWEFARDTRIQAADLQYLCVDGTDAYLPGEMFENAVGAACSCDASVLTCE